MGLVFAWGLALVAACGGRALVDGEGAGGGGYTAGAPTRAGAPETAGTAASVDTGGSVAHGGTPGTVGNQPEVACGSGLTEYQRQRDELRDKYRVGCQSDADCIPFAMVNACEGCSTEIASVQANSSSSSSLEDALIKLALSECGSCPPPPTRRCPRAAPYCTANRCFLAL